LLTKYVENLPHKFRNDNNEICNSSLQSHAWQHLLCYDMYHNDTRAHQLGVLIVVCCTVDFGMLWRMVKTWLSYTDARDTDGGSTWHQLQHDERHASIVRHRIIMFVIWVIAWERA